MKPKLEIFSKEELKNFFKNLDNFFDLTIKNFDDLERDCDKKNLSLVFLDNQSSQFEKTIKNICENENYIFVCMDFAIFQKFSLSQKNSLIHPVSINRLTDMVNNIINNKKHTFMNIELNNHSVSNIKTNEKTDLTQAENHIILKLFKEKNIKKRILERDALQIKHNLNTSSMESHLNRIRKKLKKINSHFTISSKDKFVYLEIFNQDK